jgi:hypothetical protein
MITTNHRSPIWWSTQEELERTDLHAPCGHHADDSTVVQAWSTGAMEMECHHPDHDVPSADELRAQIAALYHKLAVDDLSDHEHNVLTMLQNMFFEHYPDERLT